MKKLLFIFVVSVQSFVLKAQPNVFPTSGNVGIGTTTPASLLQLSQSISNLNLYLTNTQGNGQTWAINSDANGHFNIHDTNTNFFTILPSGNVGIGITNPGAYRLKIDGYFHSNGFDEESNYPYTKSIINGADAGNVLLNAGSTNGYVSKISIVGRSGMVASLTPGIQFSTQSVERMRIDDMTGNIGIGTVTPSEKLSVNGNISTKKVIVTQSGWSDYVFDEKYQLRSLSFLEKYINQNKHLPGVPSAKDVAENGLDLGANQAILLKKIEELTLYLIEQKKEIEKLKNQIKKK